MKQSAKTQKKGLESPKGGFTLKSIHMVVIISLAIFLVYGKILNFTFTDLDDKIFIINDYELHNELKDIPQAFTRGVFNVKETDYYRPVMNIDFTLENILNGKRKNFILYHFSSILFHLIATILLMFWMLKLNISKSLALLFTLVFAVHPSLMQAVGWIPGRNDTILACAILAAYLMTENLIKEPSIKNYASVALFALIALFTKETAFLLLLLIPFRVYQSQKLGSLFYKSSALIVSVFIFRIGLAKILVPDLTMGFNEPVIPLMLYRLPVLLQYLGKWFLPVQQSVFPHQDDTALWPGLVSFVIFGVLIFILKLHKNPTAIIGFGLFLLGMFPLLIIPRLLNEQTYEHRLYLPAAGLLLSVVAGIDQHFKNNSTIKYSVIAFILVFASLTYTRLDVFANPRVFWENAANTSPSSAYAKLMYASRLSEKELKISEKLFREAYKQNPNEKFINYYMGQVVMKENKVDSADYFYRKELATSAFVGTYFLYAEVKFKMNQNDSAIHFLQLAIEKDPMESKSYNNLILLYSEKKDKKKCQEVLDLAVKNKISLSQDLIEMVKKMSD